MGLETERVLYSCIQFAGYVLQIVPTVLLMYAPFSDENLKIVKKKLVSGFISMVVLSSFVCALLLGFWYGSERYNESVRWVANGMFGIIWIFGSIIYFQGFQKDTQCRLLCYMMSIQYGISVYTLAEISSKFIRINVSPGRHFAPYGISAVLVYLGATVILFPFIYRFLRKYGFRTLKGDSRKNIFLISTCSIILFLLYGIALLAEIKIYEMADNFTMNLCSSIWLICMLATDFLAYFIYFFCLHLEGEKEMLHMQMVAFEIQSQSMRDKIIEEKRTYHNMRHHFRTLISLSERKEDAAVQEYLRKYLQEWDRVNMRVISRNPMIDTILGYYIEQAQKQQIQIEKNLDIKESYPFDMMDMTVLLGNALENALDACKECAGKSPFIRIQMCQRKQNLLIKIENCCKSRKYRKQQDNGILQSSKAGRISGYGISSMQMIVKKYQGDLEFWEDKGIFTLRIVLNIPDEERKGG